VSHTIGTGMRFVVDHDPHSSPEFIQDLVLVSLTTTLCLIAPRRTMIPEGVVESSVVLASEAVLGALRCHGCSGVESCAECDGGDIRGVRRRPRAVLASEAVLGALRCHGCSGVRVLSWSGDRFDVLSLLFFLLLCLL
jgi:hypothetical protein